MYPDASKAHLQLTAAVAIQHITNDDSLPLSRKRELLSALNTVVRLSGLPATNLILSTEELRQRVLRHSSGGFGLSLSRWRSIKSALRAVLRNQGLIEAKGLPMDSAWLALLNRIGDRKRSGYLLELARFASSLGISPNGVDDAVFTDFLVHLTDRTLNPNPRKLAGAARSLWNRCHATDPEWPGSRISLLKADNSFALPLSSFPASFAASVAAHCLRSGADPFETLMAEDDDAADAADLAGRPARLTQALRPSTINTRQDHLRWAASALVASGLPIAQITSLDALVTPWERAKAIMRYIHTRAGGKPSTTSMHVADTLRIIAKYEAHLPPARLDELRLWRKRVAVTYQGITRRNRKLVLDLLDPARERALLQLPKALMDAADILRGKDPLGAARLALRALAISILLSIPIRLKNLIGLRLDQHLQRPDPRRRLISHIDIPAEEAKGGRPLILHVSPDLSALMNRWIEDFRPALAADACPYLFPSQGGGYGSITPQGLRHALKTVTARHVGLAINPHAFRHLAAARYLQAYPDGMEVVSQFLGHGDPATTRRHYAIINNRQSFERLDALVNPRRLAKAPEKKPARPRAPAKRTA